MSWYNTAWNYRIKVTVSHLKVGSTDQTNFPVYVNLTHLPDPFFSNVKSDGGDIRITTSDGTTETPLEVNAISTSGKTGELFFKAPTLSHTTDTDFYIYYDNPSASMYVNNSTYGKNNVWRSEFGGVYHMDDGADNQHINDSTINANTGTKTAAGNPTQTTGKLGKAQTTGVSDLINVGQGASISFSTGEFAVAAWVKKNTTTDNYNFVGNLQNSGNFDGWDIGALITSGYVEGRIRSGGTSFNATSTVNIQDNNYHRVWLVRRSTGIYVYEAGTQVASNTNASTQNTVTTSADTAIGDARVGTSNAGDSAGWPGDIDEVYLWKGTAPSADWITTDYNNQNSPSTFYTIGSQESSVSGWLAGYTYRVPITVTNSTGSTQTDCQVHITLNTSSLISAGKLQSSGNDLAATDSDKSTQINLWFDPDTINTTTTDVWVKIPSLPNGTYTIYLYYGNSGASMQSTITGTFIYGDDFSTDTSANYSTGGTISVDTTNKVLTLTGVSSGNTVAVPTAQTDPSSYIVEAKISVGSAISVGADYFVGLLGFKSTLISGDGYVAQTGVMSGTDKVDIEKYTQAHLINAIDSFALDTFYPIKGTFVSGSITVLFNNVTSTNSTDATYTSGYYGMRVYNNTGKFKYFRVRSYVSSEPTTSNGSEQSAKLPQIIIVNQSIIRASRW